MTGLRGSAAVRLEEARERQKLHTVSVCIYMYIYLYYKLCISTWWFYYTPSFPFLQKLNKLDKKLMLNLQLLYKKYGDSVTYKVCYIVIV